MSKIVVDTHILIWDALEPNKISKSARKAIDAANKSGGIVIADISLWEIAMLLQKGRVSVETDSQSFINLILQSNETIVRAITPLIATQSTNLEEAINADPADRLIAATALVEGVVLVTADANLRKAEAIPTIW